jgi:hypothetical protein
VVFHKNTSRWLLNDLWQHNASDRATPWKLLGGEGVLPRFTAASLPARSVVGRGHVSLLTDSDACHSATLRHPQCARARRLWARRVPLTGKRLPASLATAEAVAWPSPRMHAAAWVDAADVPWMFGGILGCCSAQSAGTLVSSLSVELWALRGGKDGGVLPLVPENLGRADRGWPRGAVSGGLRWTVHVRGDRASGTTAAPLYPSGGTPFEGSEGWPVWRAGAAVWVDGDGAAFLSGGYDPAAQCDLDDLWCASEPLSAACGVAGVVGVRWRADKPRRVQRSLTARPKSLEPPQPLPSGSWTPPTRRSRGGARCGGRRAAASGRRRPGGQRAGAPAAGPWATAASRYRMQKERETKRERRTHTPHERERDRARDRESESLTPEDLRRLSWGVGTRHHWPI